MEAYRVKDGFTIRTIGVQNMAVPTGKMTSEIHGMIALSESGVLLWKALENGATIDELADILTDNYEVDREQAIEDIKRFIEGLIKQGAI